MKLRGNQRSRILRFESFERRLCLTPGLSVYAYDAVGENDTILVEVSASGASEASISVNYRIEGISATPTDDYLLAGAQPGVFEGTIYFAPYEMQAYFHINAVQDELVEGNESLQVVLSDPVNAYLANDIAIAQIYDDDFNAAPLATEMTDEYRWVEDDVERLVDLSNFFSDADHQLSEMTWSATTSGPTGIVSAWVESPSSILHLNFTTGTSGVNTIKVRATDPVGAWAEGEFELYSVDVTSVSGAYNDEFDQWIATTPSDPFWDGDTAKWSVAYEPGDLPSGAQIEILRMPWSQWVSMGQEFDPIDPLLGWTMFASGPPSQPGFGEVPGMPPSGEVWAITAKLNFAGKYALCQVVKEEPVFQIIDVNWEGIELNGEDNLDSAWPGPGLRFFPEKNRYDAGPDDLHTQVMFEVEVKPNKLGQDVRIRAYDPDDPSAIFDPIDDDTAAGDEKDNRNPTPWIAGLTIMTSEVVGDIAIARKEFTPSTAIGDNYRIVVAGRATGFQHIKAKFSNADPETQARLKFDDGATIAVLGTGGPFDIPKNRIQVSEPLTVWRSLWVETDAMPPSTASFPEDDDWLDDVWPPSIGAFPAAFFPMFIDAKPLPQEFDVRQAAVFEREFATQAQLQTYFLGPQGARDTKVESDDYWTVYVASIYEFGPANPAAAGNDNDLDPEFGLMGWTYTEGVGGGAGPGVSLIAVEVLRDVAAQNITAWEQTPNSLTKALQILSLHEVGHQLLGTDVSVHAGLFPSFIMVAPSNDLQEARVPEINLIFSDEHVDVIRDTYKDGRHP